MFTGVLLARAIPAITIGPVAGVLLDRFDRKRIMIASDLIRALVALGFILAVTTHRIWVLYAFSALLMAASPFFNAGRSSILPTIASAEEIHTANSLTQTTQWMTLTVGTFLGATVIAIGYKWAFVFNAFSFVFSAWCIWHLRAPDAMGFRAKRKVLAEEEEGIRPWHEYREGLRYMRSVPLVFAIALLSVGWATGGGAAQILFTLFGEQVFNRGASGIGIIWGCAGVGLLLGGLFANWLGRRITFKGYKLTIFIDFVVHGGAYVLFSRAQRFDVALLFIFISRAAISINSVLNYSLSIAYGCQPLSRSRLCHHRYFYMDHDDGFDDGCGPCIHALQPPCHRRGRRVAKLHDGHLLGMGELDRASSSSPGGRHRILAARASHRAYRLTLHTPPA